MADALGLQGVDLRCPARQDGTGAGYVVAPPSTLPEGAYTWLNWPDLSEPPVIADAPRWLVELACGTNPRKKITADVEPEYADDPDLIKHLASALTALDFDDYDNWVAVGLALKTLDNDDEGAELWLTWSANSAKFDEADTRKRWDGFKPEKTHWRLVFTLAQALGWKNPGNPKAKAKKTKEAIAEFNKTHAVVNAGGSVCILREGVSEFGGSKLDFMAKQAFGTFYENKSVSVEKISPDGEIQFKRAPLTKVWLSHPGRRTHEGVTFAPSGAVPKGYYNLWRGFAIEPLPLGVAASALRCKRFLHHLKYNVCRGNKYHFRYLLAWMADMMQDPARKKGVALVMRGLKGTGKSKVADVLRHLLDGHAFKASKAEHIVGRFSAHLADKLLLVAEESFFAGSKADIGSLKDLITSDTITVEPKFIGAFEVRSCHRVIMITNNEWAVPATEDERRFFVLDIGEDHMQDCAYFAAIDTEMFDGDGSRALLSLLQKMDLSKVNLRAVPQTAALDTQKRLSLEVHDQFILDCLTEGEISGRAWEAGKNDPIRQEVYEAYARYAGALHVRPLAANRFGPHFEKRTGARTHQPGGGDRRRRYELPNIGEALTRFNVQLGVRPDDQ